MNSLCRFLNLPCISKYQALKTVFLSFFLSFLHPPPPLPSLHTQEMTFDLLIDAFLSSQVCIPLSLTAIITTVLLISRPLVAPSPSTQAFTSPSLAPMKSTPPLHINGPDDRSPSVLHGHHTATEHGSSLSGAHIPSQGILPFSLAGKKALVAFSERRARAQRFRA